MVNTLNTITTEKISLKIIVTADMNEKIKQDYNIRRTSYNS